ncbi:hypothetical protein C5167_001371 [Papaver somniferum]|uniref:Xrn1 helical domain-containing protein n=1 Tax=Papaver somniferum TaxID=3469 RepID=A0A4Y7KYE9_PAPSO|nr:hypothetical protein C5167_001371 [Papaver somniferum]
MVDNSPGNQFPCYCPREDERCGRIVRIPKPLAQIMIVTCVIEEFASDIKDLGQLQIGFELGSPFKPFNQLMGVFPAASFLALPEHYRKLMSDPTSPIIDFYPTECWIFGFLISGIPKLPFIDESHLLTKRSIYCFGSITGYLAPFVGFKEVTPMSKESRHSGGDPLVLCFVDIINLVQVATVTDQNLDISQKTPACVPYALRHYYYQYLLSIAEAVEDKISILRENDTLLKAKEKLNL